MDKFKEKAKQASRETSITDRWGAATSTCSESFIQGAEWGYKQAVEALETGFETTDYTAADYFANWLEKRLKN